MTITRKKIASSFVLIFLTMGESFGDTRYFVKMKMNGLDLSRTKDDNFRTTQGNTRLNFEDKRMIRSQFDRTNSFGADETSTFNPEVLNKFLEEYANKIKNVVGEKNDGEKNHPTLPDSLPLEMDDDLPKPSTLSYEHENESFQNHHNSTSNFDADEGIKGLNDTVKRNKFWGSPGSSDFHEDRNGWVTLDAIPWSKSKISKWQANNPSTTRPWMDARPWDKYEVSRPSTPDYSSRPGHDSNKPWYDLPKPNLSDNGSDKPWMKPNRRPPYSTDRYDQMTGQTQNWPPERPSWNKYVSSHTQNRPHSDIIITDDRPSNFPNNWNQLSMNKPGHFPFNNKNDAEESGNDWQDFPSKYDQHSNSGGIDDARPHFSHYQYAPSGHPPSHPSNGDGQWVLLSTNRGYSKSRQRSIKLDAINPEILGAKKLNETSGNFQTSKKEEADPTVAVMTSKRQVRLTVLPSINGTNTTTSHGGLLEVEKSFKSVDQSRKEYEMDKTTNVDRIPFNRRPIRNTIVHQPSSSAVLAAVGAGMLPATMAMMIPMMLGRRRRDLKQVNGVLKKLQNLPMQPNPFFQS